MTEIIIANEQGASHFDCYRDSDGVTLRGKRIGTWDEVTAQSASLVDSSNKIAFTIRKMGNSRISRGREIEAHRLAWSGLNYVLPLQISYFTYDVKLSEAV